VARSTQRIAAKGFDQGGWEGFRQLGENRRDATEALSQKKSGEASSLHWTQK
jgi:hypothetical protein